MYLNLLDLYRKFTRITWIICNNFPDFLRFICENLPIFFDFYTSSFVRRFALCELCRRSALCELCRRSAFVRALPDKLLTCELCRLSSYVHRVGAAASWSAIVTNYDVITFDVRIKCILWFSFMLNLWLPSVIQVLPLCESEVSCIVIVLL